MKIDDFVVTKRGVIGRVSSIYPRSIVVMQAREGLPTAYYQESDLRSATADDFKADFARTKNTESRKWIKWYFRQFQTQQAQVTV